MATLLLTVAGTALGGPIGGAIGAILGQRIDGALFQPKGRSGPRLNDLSVQVSSYGTAIPKVFGTMRVAGSVIWSTDLIERRATSHAKGQPSVTTYSYSASFAVLLSARAVAGVGRIWADGNLLRGAAGDFKTETGFRLYLGDDDQVGDPLIASIEGRANTPAHRGCAYAVFENMQLADFGNRIPSLTFELIADAGPVGIGAIAEAASGSVVRDGGTAATLAGFSAYGSSATELLRLLQAGSGARFVPGHEAIAMTDGTGPATIVADAGFGAGEGGTPARRRTVAAIETVPRTLSVQYYDAARDYQTGIQRARRPGAGDGGDQIEMPAVLDALGAKAMAEAALARAETARERRSVALDATAAAIAPGTLVDIAGEGGGGRWRVDATSLEAMVTTLDLVRVAPPPPMPPGAAPGRVLSPPDLQSGRTLLIAAELPALDDTLLAAPRLTVTANGTVAGWRRASLSYSLDDGVSWRDGGVLDRPAVLGAVVLPPEAGPATLFDLASTIEIELARDDMMLADADDAMLDAGANLALIGDELIQFGRAVPVGGRSWRLERLLRGRRGTEWAIGGQAAGDRFALIEAGNVATIDLPVSALGSSVRVIASGRGDADGPVAQTLTLAGASVRPPAPVGLSFDAAAATLSWTRRSRAGFGWPDGRDVPLGEEREAYRVDVATPAGARRQIEASTASCAIDSDVAVPGAIVEVRQIGTVCDSMPARLQLS